MLPVVPSSFSMLSAWLSAGSELHTGRTPYKEIAIALRIVEGKATVDDVKIEGPAVRLAVAGSASIPARNLDLTGGLVYSQRLLLLLIEKGAQRKESYEAVQRNAMASWKGAGVLQELVGKDPFVAKYLTSTEIQSCFNPKYYLRHLDKIFQRVFGSGARNSKKGKKR